MTSRAGVPVNKLETSLSDYRASLAPYALVKAITISPSLKRKRYIQPLKGRSVIKFRVMFYNCLIMSYKVASQSYLH